GETDLAEPIDIHEATSLGHRHRLPQGKSLPRTRDLASATRLNGIPGSSRPKLGFHRKDRVIVSFQVFISFLSDKTQSPPAGIHDARLDAGLIFDVPERGFQKRCHWTGVRAERRAGLRLGSAVSTHHTADHEPVTALAACSLPAAFPAGIVQVVLK